MLCYAMLTFRFEKVMAECRVAERWKRDPILMKPNGD